SAASAAVTRMRPPDSRRSSSRAPAPRATTCTTASFANNASAIPRPKPRLPPTTNARLPATVSMWLLFVDCVLGARAPVYHVSFEQGDGETGRKSFGCSSPPKKTSLSPCLPVQNAPLPVDPSVGSHYASKRPVSDCADILKVLADSTRLRVI